MWYYYVNTCHVGSEFRTWYYYINTCHSGADIRIIIIIIIIIIMAEMVGILRGLDASNEGDAYCLLFAASPRELNSKRI